MKQKWLSVLAIVVCMVVVLKTYQRQGTYSVVEVFDGDTISVKMEGVTEKIRLIGIDTPETKDPRKPVQCYGPEASAYTHATLEHAKVKLVADPLSSNRDRYNRLLRYVYLANGTSYNGLLLSRGFARVYTGFPFSESGTYKNLESTAKTQGVGLWVSCPNGAVYPSQQAEQAPPI